MHGLGLDSNKGHNRQYRFGAESIWENASQNITSKADGVVKSTKGEVKGIQKASIVASPGARFPFPHNFPTYSPMIQLYFISSTCRPETRNTAAAAVCGEWVNKAGARMIENDDHRREHGGFENGTGVQQYTVDEPAVDCGHSQPISRDDLRLWLACVP